MNQLTINIAYIAENQYLINKMISDLKTSGATFNLIDGSSFANGENFYTSLAEDNHPCLLMISDNFLKSQSCLNKGLTYLQSLIKKEQVIPIIIDGTEIDASGNRQLIPTEFEKVSNVIKYMNFWQEKYLDLRKLKRSIPAEEEEEFLDKLKIVRGISSEVGEYLRNLRDTNYFAFSDFSANNYEAFFRIFGDESSHLKFATKNNIPEDVIPSESATIIAAQPKIIPEVAKETPIEPTTKIEELPVVETVTNDFLPFDNLITEKEKIDKLSAEELASVDANTYMDNVEEGHIAPSNEIEINSDTPIEKVDETEKEDLIALDPEWRQLALEEEQIVELEDDETSLNDVSASEERSLTETELLALKLAQQLPAEENVNASNQLNVLEEEEEEEMISLDDLMGDDLMEEKIVEVASTTEVTNGSTTKSARVTANNIDLFTDVNGSAVGEATTNDQEEEDDDDEELEGYFMDEGEETEDLIEELSEIDVLQSSNILVHSGKVEEGIALLKETLFEAPEFVSVRYQYAAFLAKYQNDFKEASNQLALLLEQEPHNLSAKFFLGELAEVERDYLTAKNYYEKVHHDNPEFPNVSYKLGMLMVNHLTDRPEVAAKYLAESFRFDKKNINALYQFGLIQNEGLQKEEAAIAAFEEVLAKAPEHPFANYDLAVIYHKRGESKKALQFYTKSAEINPELKTAVNDQAFAIATDEVAAKEIENIGLAEMEKTKESYTISNLVANVHSNQDRNETSNLLQNNDTTPLEEDLTTETILEEIKLPNPTDKIVLITGATSGIGRATATKFAQAGYQLILTGRRFSRLFQLKEQFENEFDTKVRLLPFDIKSSSAVKDSLAELEEGWQAVDILINNAGLAKGETPIHEGELANWEEMIDTNLKGLLYVTREIAPHMVKRGKGQIINVCSLAGKEVYPNNAVYCATKHAVDGLSKAMRIDLHKYNIKVSQISPGYVEDTEFANVKTGDGDHQITDFVPINAQDVAEVIYFMTTQPNHVTMQEVVMTGTQQASANIIDRSGRA